jgi:hypothetical protein
MHDMDAMRARVHNDLTNHPPQTPEVAETLDRATQMFIDVGEWIVDNVPPGREQSLALTQLEQLSMWTKAGIARNQ